MTKRDYEVIARALKDSKPVSYDKRGIAQWQYIVRHMVGTISLDNIRFDAGKFYDACGYNEKDA